ncbi:MAG TPA: HAMP domain-containing sensor histidine kinase [Vicinamibacterales bacterium]|nr:HAMP domain-containing sensor histidine kinase [Vicinamibacterales bacterium]
MTDADEIRKRPPEAELLSLAVHELRTPVTVVSGYLRMLARHQVGPLSERQQKIVEEAERSCGRLTSLVAELGELVNYDSGSVTLRRQDVALRELLEGIVAEAEEGRDRGVKVAFSAEGDTIVVGDRVRLRTALSSLLLAVLREQTAAGEVAVTLGVREAQGRPMAAIAIGRDVEPDRLFAASNATLDEFRGGLGLALPIARRIIDRHGGRVWSSGNGRLIGPVAVVLPLRENRS